MRAVTSNFWRLLALISVIGFAYATVLARLAQTWWVDENYSHGLLIPFVIGCILWLRRDRLSAEPANPSPYLGLATILFALFALWAGVAGAELYTQRLSLGLIIVGLIVFFSGPALLKQVAVPLVLFFLSIPIPTILFNKIAFPLQLFASRCAVWSMRLFGIPVLREGNIIELMPRHGLVTQKLEVVEACSGIRSLMTLVTLAVVYAYFTGPGPRLPIRPKKPFAWLRTYAFWRFTILCLSAIPIAIVTNAFRVSGTGVLAHYYGTRVADGFFHSFSGWVIYVAAFLLLFFVGWLLDRFKPTRGEQRSVRPENNRDLIVSENITAPTVQVASAEGSEL